MKAALESQLERELLCYRQTVLQTDHRETIGAANPVLELITAGHGSVFPEARLDPECGFPARRRRRKTVAGKITNRRNRPGRKPLCEEELCQCVDLVRRAEGCLRRISRIRS